MGALLETDVVSPCIFSQMYEFNDLQIGLCFIPFGVGGLLAPILNGKIMDWRFRVLAHQIGMPIQKGRTVNTRNFPLERARVPLALILVLIGNTTMLVYGWVVEVNAPLAAPSVLLFIIGFSLTGCEFGALVAFPLLTLKPAFNCCSVLLVDLYPNSPVRLPHIIPR